VSISQRSRIVEPFSFRSAILDFERTWLGLTAPPLADRMAAAGWSPNPPESYCRRCGSTVSPHEADDTGCSWCRDKKLRWERMIRLGEFSGLLREMVHEVKFTRWRRLGHDLGRMLGESINLAIEVERLDRERTVLVPVPMSIRRRISRGIDHAVAITRGVAAATGLPMVSALSRRHTASQVGLPAVERKSSVERSFTPKRGVSLADLTAIVIDDVTTTRATLSAACRSAAQCSNPGTGKGKDAVPRLWTAVLAVTPEQDPR
jgi:predicted amidophosphoribosyltransferase